jgi:hypothetical protein
VCRMADATPDITKRHRIHMHWPRIRILGGIGPQPGGIRITEEQEFLVLRRRLRATPKRCRQSSRRRMPYAVRSRKSRLKMWNPGLARTRLE